MKGGRARGRRVERDDDEDVEGGWSGQEESHVSVEHRVVGKVSSGSRVDESSDSDQGRRWNGRGRRTPSLTLSERWIPKRIERRVSKSPNMSPGNRRYRERSPILSWIFGKKPSPGIRNVRKARGKGRGRRIRKDKTEWLRNSVRNSIRFWEKVAPKTFQARAALVLVSLFTLYVVDFYKITEEILQDRVVKVQRSNAFEVDSKKLLQNSLPFSSSQRSGGPSIILPGPSRNETISKGLNATVKEKPGEQSSRKPATTKEREKTRNDDDERGKSQSTGVTVEPGLTPGSSKNSSESESKDTSIVADNSKSTDVGQAAVLGNDLGSKAKNPSENAHEISRESVFEPKSKPSKSGDMQSENGSSASDGDIEANSSSRSVASTGGDFSGESPFNRQREDLAVPGGLGELSSEEVKRWYTRLALAYLKPFQSGISRKAMLGILRRRNYALTPPGASKGVQSMLFQIKNNKVFLMDPYEVPKNSKPFYRNRINELIWILSRLATAERLPDTEFLVAIHDCVQTVSKQHNYRVAKFVESNPSFTIVGCNFSDNIPFPMWEGDESRGGGYSSWEVRMKEYAEDPYPWDSKLSKAVFRGGIRTSTYFNDKGEYEKRCAEVGRARLADLNEQHPDSFDVSVYGSCGEKTYELAKLAPRQHHQFKYILYTEGNCFWADRINRQLFGPSVVIKQETPCGQFFEPLLKPMTHYVPTDFFFLDTSDRIAWLKENDAVAKEIVKNANEFAWNFLSLAGMESYVEVLLKEYTKLLMNKEIKVENGAMDVTGLGV